MGSVEATRKISQAGMPGETRGDRLVLQRDFVPLMQERMVSSPLVRRKLQSLVAVLGAVAVSLPIRQTLRPVIRPWVA
jgi:hypothetical protein